MVENFGSWPLFHFLVRFGLKFHYLALNWKAFRSFALKNTRGLSYPLNFQVWAYEEHCLVFNRFLDLVLLWRPDWASFDFQFLGLSPEWNPSPLFLQFFSHSKLGNRIWIKLIALSFSLHNNKLINEGVSLHFNKISFISSNSFLSLIF